MKITKMLCIALCALIWLCAGAQAAPDMNMADIRVQLDGAEYAFPMRDADCGEMTLPDVLPEAGCYAIADADDGTNTFRVRVDHCEGEAWLTGFEINARNAGAKAGALTIGETTRKAALEIMGEAVHATENTLEFAYGFDNYRWTLTFRGEGDDALLVGIAAHSEVIARYGAPAEAAEAALCDAGQSVQTLLDNGWRLPKAYETKLIPAAGDVQMGESVVDRKSVV